MATSRIRIHLKVEEGKSPLSEWTFDHPRKVTVGYSPSASIQLYSASAQARAVLFERTGNEIRLRVSDDTTGALLVDGKEVSFSALQDAGALKVDRKGAYVLLRTKTQGIIHIGDARLRFWVAPTGTT